MSNLIRSLLAEHYEAVTGGCPNDRLEDPEPCACLTCRTREALAEPAVVPGAMLNPATDGRAKRWEYIVRFWEQTPLGPDLIGETGRETMKSTGAIPEILATLAAQQHDGWCPDELSIAALEKKLRQFRNNLARGNNATLRIPYSLWNDTRDEAPAKVEFACQMDVFRVPRA